MKRPKYTKEKIMRDLWLDFVIYQHENIQPGIGVQGPGKWFNISIDKDQKRMLEKYYDEFMKAMR